jgi:hypothetical protein
MAAVLMDSGYEVSLLKLEIETVTNNLDPRRGRLKRGKFYRVTFEEIQPPITAMSP